MEFSQRVAVGKDQLKAIFSMIGLNPENYSWADCWAGDGVWSIVLSQLSKKNVLYVDNSETQADDFILNQKNLNFVYADTCSFDISKTIDAIFLRSCASVPSIIKTIETQKNAEIFVFIAEGLNIDPIDYWRKYQKEFEKFYNKVEFLDPDLPYSLRGSNSKTVSLNRQVPVVFCSERIR